MEKTFTRRDAFRLGGAAMATAVGAAIAGAPAEAQAVVEYNNESNFLMYEPPYNGASFKRIWGNNALDTMEELISETNAIREINHVFVCPNNDWHSALAATGAIGSAGAIVLTNPKKLSSQARRCLSNLTSVYHIVIVGDKTIVSEAVEKDIKRLVDGRACEISRVVGKDHVDTSLALERDFGGVSDTIAISRVDDYADALAFAPIANYFEIPIIFTPKNPDDSFYKRIRSMYKDRGVRYCYILGGTAAISSEVETKLCKLLPDGVERFAGKNAVDTSALIAEYFTSRDIEAGFELVGTNRYCLVTRNSYKDALSAAAYAAHRRAPILLVTPKNRSAIKRMVDSTSNYHRAFEFDVIGGPKAVPESVIEWTHDYIKKRK